MKHYKAWKDYSKKTPYDNYTPKQQHSSMPKFPHSDIRNAVRDIERIDRENNKNYSQTRTDIKGVTKDLERIHSDMTRNRK